MSIKLFIHGMYVKKIHKFLRVLTPKTDSSNSLVNMLRNVETLMFVNISTSGKCPAFVTLKVL